MKFSESSVLPLPLYLDTCGYGNNGRVRVPCRFGPGAPPSACLGVCPPRPSAGSPPSGRPGSRRAAEPVIDARREKQASKPPDLFPAAHRL